MRRDLKFRSEGADLNGWVYVPDSGPPWPLVVMAHGFSATRHMTANKYTEVLRAAGYSTIIVASGTAVASLVSRSTRGSRLVATAMPFRMEEALKGWM
jgi:fermentation-respiration switch protein FrsA (DUF1100 family)